MEPVRVLLVDDHPLFRAGIRALIEQIAGFQVVGEAENGEQAVEQSRKCKPDIVLMDISMPGVNGLDTTARVLKVQPNVRVIILSMHAEKEYVLQAFQAGAKGYLLKGARPTELELAISAVARGGVYISPGASQYVVESAMQHADETDLLKTLSPRQRQVLYYIARGEGRKAIALKLGLSAKTVDAYRSQLMRKLDIHDVASLVRYALKAGVLEEE
jgi:DNA-binding NarL/FixJ family response regulator